MMEFQDSTYASGLAGVKTWGKSQVAFDDARVTAVK